MKYYDMFAGSDLVIAEKINRRRYQILVHSNIYYGQDTNLISDRKFDELGHELAELQAEYPQIAAKLDWADAFRDFDGSTGAFLPYKDSRIQSIADTLLSLHKVSNTQNTAQTKQRTASDKPQVTIKRKKLF